MILCLRVRRSIRVPRRFLYFLHIRLLLTILQEIAFPPCEMSSVSYRRTSKQVQQENVHTTEMLDALPPCAHLADCKLLQGWLA